MASGAARAIPPRWPREAIERMNTPGSVAWTCIRNRSPSNAPPVNGEVGSIASTATVLSRDLAARTNCSANEDFPTPGEPVRPTVYARPVFG